MDWMRGAEPPHPLRYPYKPATALYTHTHSTYPKLVLFNTPEREYIGYTCPFFWEPTALISPPIQPKYEIPLENLHFLFSSQIVWLSYKFIWFAPAQLYNVLEFIKAKADHTPLHTLDISQKCASPTLTDAIYKFYRICVTGALAWIAHGLPVTSRYHAGDFLPFTQHSRIDNNMPFAILNGAHRAQSCPAVAGFHDIHLNGNTAEKSLPTLGYSWIESLGQTERRASLLCGTVIVESVVCYEMVKRRRSFISLALTCMLNMKKVKRSLASLLPGISFIKQRVNFRLPLLLDAPAPFILFTQKSPLRPLFRLPRLDIYSFDVLFRFACFAIPVRRDGPLVHRVYYVCKEQSVIYSSSAHL